MINPKSLAPSLGYGIVIFMSDDIPVEDCDQCLNPFWADQLTDGLCPTCGVNDLESFFE